MCSGSISSFSGALDVAWIPRGMRGRCDTETRPERLARRIAHHRQYGWEMRFPMHAADREDVVAHVLLALFSDIEPRRADDGGVALFLMAPDEPRIELSPTNWTWHASDGSVSGHGLLQLWAWRRDADLATAFVDLRIALRRAGAADKSQIEAA